MHLQLGSYKSIVEFTLLGLGSGFEVVLGDDWLSRTRATLRYADGTCVIHKGQRRITLSPTRQARRPTRTSAPAKQRRHTGDLLGPIATPDANPKPKRLTTPLLSAMQFKKAIYKRGAECFLVMLEKNDVKTDVHTPTVRKLLEEFHDVLDKFPKGLPPDRDDAHVIPLEPGSTSVWRPMYRFSPLEHHEVKKQVVELLDLGWIEPSTSPYGSPVLFVSKKDGGLRMCIDFRALNKQTVKNRYTLPRIDDLIDQLREAIVFSSLDLRAGYNQIRLQPDDAPKTAFQTPFGHYQDKVMYFGLTNAPTTFQSVMNNLFRPYIGKHVLVYMDDILVFSKNDAEHIGHLRDVLITLRKNSFYAKASKCTFFERELVYLGHIVDNQDVRPDTV